MKVAVFSTKAYDETHLNKFNEGKHEFTYIPARLTKLTASLADGHEAICCFVNDQLSTECIEIMANYGVQYIAMRCAGYNNVDLNACAQHNIKVVRVPEYSPYAVAEHAVALMMDLNRNIHRAFSRVREHYYILDGLLGFDMYGKTIGVIGTGKIGVCLIKIMLGFGCKVVAYDLYPSDEVKALGVDYRSLNDLYKLSDVISLHCPLNSDTHHMINAAALNKMKKGVMIINTSRGGLVDTVAVIEGLKTEQIGHLGLDVYEEETDLFFEDFSNTILQDDVFARLLTFSNVVITGHQAFFTREALDAISKVTLNNLTALELGDLDKACLIPFP
ncbi:2-hydroxyacid dehydrogenase [Colwellia sp. E2M01]|uniref:2-hydroxyacid dehydrogenase n=1 Tax=Colwellia sp. E2M01 TaxID=2841561 RepID=UPI001C0A1748|nr:2-hydroxyacid dehydrogenase [Colwellia sp. E2M01]MBU2869703.1 2-hydroxyacid dehydrogenase [Colwellia sp. E2M01]